jgi:hypothetical protein
MSTLYKNTFEIFGDEGKCEAESKRDFALAYLPMFEREANGEYRISALRSSERVGMNNEIRWMDRVFDECHDIVEGDMVRDEPDSGLISETRLLDYLEEAVEEVIDAQEK